MGKDGFPGGLESKEFTSMQETWVGSLGWEDTLEKIMAIHSVFFAWRIPWPLLPPHPS